MDQETKRLINIGFALCGPIFVITYIIFWAILGHNVPPPNMMGMSAEQLITDYYGKYQSEIAVGMIGCATVGMLYTPWSLLLATLLREDDGSLGVLSLTEAAGGILTGWLLAFCPAMWATCALLANSISPELVRTLHVMTWVIYDCTYMITTIQLIALGTYIVLNKKQTMFPAWTGWCAIAIGIIFVPLVLMPFVTDGPFAVGGTWNFFFVFGIWLFAFQIPIGYYMLKAVAKRAPVTRQVLSHAN
ncbi:MAG: hypothetical protein RJA98_2094 [Pseudomonadota bacterium]